MFGTLIFIIDYPLTRRLLPDSCSQGRGAFAPPALPGRGKALGRSRTAGAGADNDVVLIHSFFLSGRGGESVCVHLVLSLFPKKS